MTQYTMRVLFFFNDTATTEIYTLSLHDALPICFVGFGAARSGVVLDDRLAVTRGLGEADGAGDDGAEDAVGEEAANLLRSEEHTSELQSRQYLVCRLLLEKKKKHFRTPGTPTSR